MRAIAAAPWDLDCEGKEKEGVPALRASMFIDFFTPPDSPNPEDSGLGDVEERGGGWCVVGSCADFGDF